MPQSKGRHDSSRTHKNADGGVGGVGDGTMHREALWQQSTRGRQVAPQEGGGGGEGGGTVLKLSARSEN